MQAFDAIRHSPGRDARDLRYLSGGLFECSSVGDVGFVSFEIGVGQRSILAEFCLKVCHQTGCLES
jgi:hypothetical protein